jgi:hypothetical protein
MSYELAILDFALYVVEMLGNQRNTPRITNKNNIIGKLFGQKVKMENASIGINY